MKKSKYFVREVPWILNRYVLAGKNSKFRGKTRWLVRARQSSHTFQKLVGPGQEKLDFLSWEKKGF